MTDRFEESVRHAARGLGVDSNVDMPGYEDAWRRGRRRRAVKQGGLALAGALIIVVALGVNAGRLGNSPSIDVDDVAVGVGAATAEPAQTPPPTTPPIALSPPPAPSAQEQLVTPPTASEPVPSEPSSVSEADPPTAVLPPPTSPPAAAAIESGPVPTPQPTATTAPTQTPTPTPEAAVDTAARTPEPTPEETEALDSPPTTAAGTEPAPTPTVETATVGPEATLPIAPATAPDAVLLDPVAPGQIACDTSGDGKPDASCELFPDYACISAADLRSGYAVADNDEDGAVDTCRSTARTTCDSVGDGRPDTPCVIIRSDATNESPVEPPADE